MKILLLIIFTIFLSSCFPSPTTFDGQYTPKVAAEKNLEWCKDATDRGYYEEANQYLDFVKKNFPYELEIQEKVQVMYGDILFAQADYISAIELYQNFIKRYPDSLFVPEAQFKIALSYYKEIPSDFFLLPPPYEKDKDSLINARESLMFYIGKYPKDKNITESKKMLETVLDYIVQYEYYVGNFYYEREKYQGAIWRFEPILRNYPGSSYEKDILYKIIKSYLELKNKEKVVYFTELYLKKYPKDEFSIELKNMK